MDDEELDLLPEPTPHGEGYDDFALNRGDLTRPQGGHPLTDEEDQEEQLRVYREEGDRAVAEAAQEREDGSPPRARRR